MKRSVFMAAVLAILLVGGLASGASAGQMVINGAGASFPYPLYSQWIHEYTQMFGVRINYQSIGSGGGIAQVRAGTVDFGASDAPLKPAQLKRWGLVQFPMIVGGVVVVVNLEGVGPGALKLSRKALAGIFLGRIRKWNNPAIAATNPGLNLPDRRITVIHRADGSGTTCIFTSYLSRISPEWRQKVGWAKAVRWPVGIGAKGNEGVAAYVQRVRGSIGYVELAYAVHNHLSHALLENHAGKFVAPSIDSFQAAAANADWSAAPGFYIVLTDQPGDSSWPITGASFILLRKNLPDEAKAKTMLKFFDWCYRHGADTARKLMYVPLPMKVVKLVEGMWSRELTSGGKKLWR